MIITNWHTMQPGLYARMAVLAKRFVIPISDLEIFKKKRLCFIHIPKTGGTSIAKMFFERGALWHYKWWFYAYYFGYQTYKNMFSFSMCRDPFSRLVSAYTYLAKGGNNDNDMRFSKSHMSGCESFYDFVVKLKRSKEMQSWIHFLPQYQFIFDKNLRLRVDYLARFENFSSEVDYLASKLKKSVTLAHEKKGEAISMSSFYDSGHVIDIVRRLYKKDFELLGYNTFI